MTIPWESYDAFLGSSLNIIVWGQTYDPMSLSWPISMIEAETKHIYFFVNTI